MEKWATPCGAAADSFEKGADLLHQTTGLRLANRLCSGADVRVAIRDGGLGQEGGVRTYFPRVSAVILDFDHASEYLARLAKGLHPSDEAAAQSKSWCRVLRDKGGHARIGVLKAWEWPSRRGLAAVRVEVLGYFRNQVERMDDPTYDANGRLIGSGRWRARARRWWVSG